MTKIPTLVKGFAVLVFVLLGVAVVSPSSASAAAGNPAYCDPAVPLINNQAFGAEVPVIMVHGRNGSASDWGGINNNSSFAGRVNDLPGVAVAHRFNYNTENWVTHQNSGPRLAKTIDCISQLSLQHGGNGKVIVVGYSMGGLVTREALSKRSTDNQRAIADEVGQVVTIGTPHVGILFPFAGAWSYNSAEMNALPKFPTQTVVHTIAGDITEIKKDWRGRDVRTDLNHDTLVARHSAHSGFTDNEDIGGGFTDFACDKRYNWFGSAPLVGCEHGQLIAWENNGVREDTMNAINKYVASLTPAPQDISLTVGSLTLTYDNRWANVTYGASGPGQDSLATDTTNKAPCTNCTTTPPPDVSAGLMVINMADWCTGTTLSCMIGDYSVVGAAPDITIGGRTPDYAVRYIRGQYQGTALAWCFEAGKVCLEYDRPVDTPQLEMSDAAYDVFATGAWTN